MIETSFTIVLDLSKDGEGGGGGTGFFEILSMNSSKGDISKDTIANPCGDYPECDRFER